MRVVPQNDRLSMQSKNSWKDIVRKIFYVPPHDNSAMDGYALR